jgi:hypothetical protein
MRVRNDISHVRVLVQHRRSHQRQRPTLAQTAQHSWFAHNAQQSHIIPCVTASTICVLLVLRVLLTRALQLVCRWLHERCGGCVHRRGVTRRRVPDACANASTCVWEERVACDDASVRSGTNTTTNGAADISTNTTGNGTVYVCVLDVTAMYACAYRAYQHRCQRRYSLRR